MSVIPPDRVLSRPSATGSDVQGGPVGELLDVAVECPAIDELEVEVGRALEDRVRSGLTGDDRAAAPCAWLPRPAGARLLGAVYAFRLHLQQHRNATGPLGNLGWIAGCAQPG